MSAYWPDRVERITGIPVTALRETVHTLAEAESAMILTARGAEQHSNGTETAQAYINLALALGLVGRPYSGYGTITGQGNGQGGREHGQKADQLPGYRKLADPQHRAYVAGVWGIDPDELPQPGLSAFEMLDRMGTDGGVRALLVMASNVVVSAPDVNRVRDRLAALDLLVVSDIFLSETAELADVVLPCAQWAEEEGTMTNLEGRVIRRRRALPPPEGVLDDLTVLKELADRLGRGQYFSADPREVYAELRRASAGGIADYAGISWERIEAEQGVFWPCPSEDHPGTPRLFADDVPHAGRAGAVHPGGAPGPGRDPRRRLPVRADHRPADGPVPERHPDPPGARALPGHGAARGPAAPRPRPPAADRPGRHRPADQPAGRGDLPGDDQRRHPARHRLRPVPLGRRVGGERPDQPGPGPVLPDARLQGLRGEPAPRRRPRRHPPAGRAAAPPALSLPSRPKEPPMLTQNRFLQGVFPFEGAGLDKPAPLADELSYLVPDGVVAQALYFRGGNTTDELITVVLMRDGVPMRYFPIGAKGDVHVPLRVVEDIDGGSVVELRLAAPLGLSGMVVVDLGLVEH